MVLSDWTRDEHVSFLKFGIRVGTEKSVPVREMCSLGARVPRTGMFFPRTDTDTCEFFLQVFCLRLAWSEQGPHYYL